MYHETEHIYTLSKVFSPHLTMLTLTLCNRVRLYVSIIVLACPHKPSLTLEGLGHHVVNQTVFIPDPLLLKLSLVLPDKMQDAGVF